MKILSDKYCSYLATKRKEKLISKFMTEQNEKDSNEQTICI